MVVAQARFDCIENIPSLGKTQAETSALPCPASNLQGLLSLICCCSTLVWTEKQKLLAAAAIDAPTPITFQGFKNNPVQVPLAQVQHYTAEASAKAFAAGTVAFALPAPVPALQQAAILHVMGSLPDGRRLLGR